MRRWLPVMFILAATASACSGQQQRQAQDSVQDASTSAQVMAKLVSVDADAANAMHVSASGDAVTLSGEAKSMDEKREYLAAAQSVSGAGTIVDRIRVNPRLTGIREQTNDAVLESKVSGAIAAQAGVNVFHIEVTAKSGVVTVRGTVPSKAIAQTVVDTARGVSGVHAVDDSISVGR